MGFVQNDVFMRTCEAEFTHITRVDLQLRGNDSAKISKKLKLPTCASIFVQMESDLEILRNGFCLEYGKLSNKTRQFFKIRIGLEDMGGGLTRICPNCNKTQIFEDFI
jgi:hypothetical protein